METYEWRRGAYKKLSLRVLASGQLRVTSPWYLPRFLADQFVSRQAEWIAERRRTLQPLESDSASVWGELIPLRVVSPGRLPRVFFHPDAKEIVLRVPATWTGAQRQKVINEWEKERVREALQTLIPMWQTRTGLKADKWVVKRLRSRWGSCRPETNSLVFNSRLGAFPKFCLEYVVVHELAHLMEPSHNARFHALVESWFPGAAEARKLLKRASGGTVPADSDVFPDLPAKLGGGKEL